MKSNVVNPAPVTIRSRESASRKGIASTQARGITGRSNHHAGKNRSPVTRIDLHLHSRASTRTVNWFLQSAGSPESYTDPEDAYRKAKRRGMGLVTLTDHDTIDGGREIDRVGGNVFEPIDLLTE